MNHYAVRRSNILVMQHDPLLCAGLAAALREHPAFEVFVSGTEEECSDRERIDVVVADYRHAMRLINSSIRMSSRPLATARILALTSNDRETDIRRALEAGIHGYLLRGGALSELIEGVTKVANGMRYLCRPVAKRMADRPPRAALTSREVEVLRFVVTGESNKAIARQLRIELGTVKSHVSAIMTKLNATWRA